MRNRFYVPQPLAVGKAFELTGEEFHHAVRVHRSRVGEEVEVFDGRGNCVTARIDSIGKSAASLTITGTADRRDASLQIQLALALIQPDRFELVLQKATELGVTSFIPLITERSEVRAERATSKLDRWNKIVLEAAKQSGRSKLPQIEQPTRFDDAIGRPGTRVIFEAEQSSEPLSPDASSIMLLVGPEGGWSDSELDAARRAGCTFRTLGPRRLRAETAAIAAVTLVGIMLGDLSQ